MIVVDKVLLCCVRVYMLGCGAQINFSLELDFVSKIGSGSFGDVWRASLAGFTCAVKVRVVCQ